jgi:hypothetical protein
MKDLRNLNEIDTINLINLMSGTKLKSTNSVDEYCSFDAYSEHYIVEIKNSRKHYYTKMMEEYKFRANIAASKKLGKIFLYIVTDPKGVYIYNISEIEEIILKDKPTVMHCPKTTDFDNKAKQDKYCYNLSEGLAKKKYPIESIESR